MPRKTMRVPDVKGQWVEIDPAEVRPQPIRRNALKKLVLERIALVHEALRDVLAARNDQPMLLEEFEIGFMRSQSPENELMLWEAIALALEKAQSRLPPEQHNRKLLYQRLVLAIFGALTDEELREEQTITILRCFRSSYPPHDSAASTQRAGESAVAPGVVSDTCAVCCKRVTRAGAMFCPRCGRRLPVLQNRK